MFETCAFGVQTCSQSS